MDLGISLALVYEKKSLPHGPAQLTEDPHCGIGSTLRLLKVIFYATVSLCLKGE